MRDTVLPAAGDLVITEVMPNPAAVSDTLGEWFEIQALNDVRPQRRRPRPRRRLEQPQRARPRRTASTSRPASYAVFAQEHRHGDERRAPDGGDPRHVHVRAGQRHRRGAGRRPVMLGPNVLDAITWTSTRAGRSHQLDPDIDRPGRERRRDQLLRRHDRVTAAATSARPARSTSSARSRSSPGMCLDSGTPARDRQAGRRPARDHRVPREPGQRDGVTDAQREWFEIKNTGATAFDLNGLGLARTGGDRERDQPGRLHAGRGRGLRAVRPLERSGGQRRCCPRSTRRSRSALIDSNGNIEVRDGATILDVITWTRR